MEARLKTMIASAPIVIFSKTWCAYCATAKRLLQREAQGKQVAIFEIDTLAEEDAIQSTLGKMTGRRTVPNIFIGGKNVGGCDSVTALHSSNKLAPLIAAA